MLQRPRRTYAVLAVILVASFALSGVGADKTPSDGGTYWLGAAGWLVFCVALLALALVSMIFVVRGLRARKRRAA